MLCRSRNEPQLHPLVADALGLCTLQFKTACWCARLCSRLDCDLMCSDQSGLRASHGQTLQITGTLTTEHWEKPSHPDQDFFHCFELLYGGLASVSHSMQLGEVYTGHLDKYRTVHSWAGLLSTLHSAAWLRSLLRAPRAACSAGSAIAWHSFLAAGVAAASLRRPRLRHMSSSSAWCHKAHELCWCTTGLA